MPQKQRVRRVAFPFVYFLFAAAVLAAGPPLPSAERADVVVLISADAEWATAEALISSTGRGTTPFGAFLSAAVPAGRRTASVVYVRGGWGKVSAAASTQYAIDRWKPAFVINIGTCGGFEGRVKPNDVLLVRKTVIYDIYELMGDAQEAIADYSTTLDLGWLKTPFPTPVIEAVLVSADRDLRPEDIPGLIAKYGAVAADWESGAIAYTAKRNHVPCLILRAVSDIVGRGGSEAYGNLALFRERAAVLMKSLLGGLPRWLVAADAVLTR